MYENKSAVVKHKKLKHSLVQKVFKCSKCDKEFSQAHSLREHVRDIHKIAATIEDVKRLVSEPSKSTIKTSQSIQKPKYPKRIHEKITCKCGQTNKGKWVFKRHCLNSHGSSDFEKYIKSENINSKPSKKSKFCYFI